MLTVVNILDKGVWDVTLTPGLYDINGSQLQVAYPSKIVTIPQNSVIKKIDKRTQIVGYRNEQNDVLTVAAFSLKRNELLEPAIAEDDDEFPMFDELDAEYAYKRFLKEWVPVYDNIEIVSEVQLDIRDQVTDTGNQFIAGTYFFGVAPEQAQYVYNREPALRRIVSDVFTALGMTFDETVKSYSQTNNKKVWGISRGGILTFGLSSVVAFNGYVLSDNIPSVKVRGSLDEMKAAYDTDVENITAIIKVAYAKHFDVKVPVTVLPDTSLNKLYTDANDLLRNLTKVDPKAKTDYEYRAALQKADALKKALQTALADAL